MKGSTYKRCKCRDADGKELGKDCPKLRRKDGSWNPKHGSWYFRLELEPGPNGKRRTLRRGGFASETDASNAMDEAKAKEARGGNAQSKLLVGQYLDEWLASNKSLRRTSRKSYTTHIRNYLKPHLGHVELDRLRVGHVTEMFDAIDAENERIAAANVRRRELRQAAQKAWRAGDKQAHKKALDELDELPPHRRVVGSATKQRIRATLRSALSDALSQGLVTVNVAKLVRLDSGKRPKAVVWTRERVKQWQAEFAEALEAAGEPADSQSGKAFKIWLSLPRPSKVMVWTPEQTGLFLDLALQHRLYAMFHLVAFRGLRRGEACGLEWVDLDLDAGELMIRNQRVPITYSDIEEGAPKTEGSEDTIPLDSTSVKLLQVHRAQQKEDQLAWGREAWVRSGKVFTRENGEPLHPDMVSRIFARLAFEAGLPPIRLHDLRHGAATLMLAGGAEMKLVQALLRHSSITITSDTYTSVLPDVAREAAEAAVALVPRAVTIGESGTDGLPSGSPEGAVTRRTPRHPGKAQVRTVKRSGAGGTRTRDQRIMSPTEDMPDGVGQ